jgi:hypothetical protein
LTVIAPLFGAGETQMLAQRIEQRRARIDRQPAHLLVDRQIEDRREARIGCTGRRRSAGAFLAQRHGRQQRCGGSGCAQQRAPANPSTKRCPSAF